MSYSRIFLWKISALSFYRSKIILDHTNCFGRVQFVLVRSILFWLGPKHLGQVQIRLVWTIFFIIWTCPKRIWIWPKRIRLVQNDWYSTKMIWTDQNHFGTTEGQGKGLQQSSNREYRALKSALPVFLFLEWETYIVHMSYEGKKLYQINPKWVFLAQGTLC